jgi:hypothetical protein
MAKGVKTEGSYTSNVIHHGAVTTITIGIGNTSRYGNYSLVIQSDAGSEKQARDNMPHIIDEIRTMLLQHHVQQGSKA